MCWPELYERALYGKESRNSNWTGDAYECARATTGEREELLDNCVEPSINSL